MIKLRYADYPKDYFLGVLPASQYGSVAVLPSVPDPGVSLNGYAVVEASTNAVSVNNQTAATRDPRINSDLSAPPIVTGKQIGRAHV